MFDNNYKGQGIMSEAIIVNYGFRNMGLERIEAFVEPNNTPSIKLLKKMSFKKESLLKQHYFYNNRMEDSIVFALLKSDYN